MTRPSINRSAIMAALFARLQTAGFTTCTRKYRDVPDVGEKEQPFLCLLSADKQTPEYEQEGARPKWTLSPIILIYARVPPANDPLSAGEVIDPLVDAVDAALLWAPGDGPVSMGSPTGLGGLVTHCRIGEVLVGEGGKSGQAFIQITLNILAAGM